jgi:hypothetical protein
MATVTTLDQPMKPKPSPTPFTRSYWVVSDQLIAGCYPGDRDPATARQKLGGLVRCGVGLIINLMHPDEHGHDGEPFKDYRPMLEEIASKAGRRVRCERLSIYDNDVPTVAQMRKILDTIDRANAAGETVFVHCWGGKGRTGTVVGCYLARHKLAVGDAALRRVKELTQASSYDFGPVPQTAEQCDFVRNWAVGQ